jgi:hypothetical protein
MRLILTSAAALIAGALLIGAGTTGATAAPLPSIASIDAATLDAASTAVTKVDWRRRYYRRNGVWPPVTGPGAVVEPGVLVETDDGEVVVVAPLRPASCGEFHYWNGVACIDARFNDPYIGPK